MKQTLYFAKNVEFEGDTQPKLEIKEEKTNSPKVKIEIKREFKVETKDEPLDDKGEFDDELQKGLLVLDTMDFETRMDTENGQFEAEMELDNAVHDDKQYECSICKKEFAQEKELKHHVTTIHDEKKAYNCSKCEDRFSSKRDLKKHTTAVHVEKMKWKCPICEKEFGQKGHLKHHVTTVHEEKMLHKCSRCARCFGSSSILKKHIASIHEGKGPHKCSNCELEFSQKR